MTVRRFSRGRLLLNALAIQIRRASAFPAIRRVKSIVEHAAFPKIFDPAFRQSFPAQLLPIISPRSAYRAAEVVNETRYRAVDRCQVVSARECDISRENANC